MPTIDAPNLPPEKERAVRATNLLPCPDDHGNYWFDTPHGHPAILPMKVGENKGRFMLSMKDGPATCGGQILMFETAEMALLYLKKVKK